MYINIHVHMHTPGKIFYNAINCERKRQCAACVNGHQI